jgi:hypothetical protein
MPTELVQASHLAMTFHVGLTCEDKYPYLFISRLNRE